LFFCSSRRRHTRSKRDWSSDVCSSDLISMSDRILLMDGQPGTIKKIFTIPSALRETKPFYVRRHEAYQALFDEIWRDVRGKKERSEERRVGKEGKVGRWRCE